MGKNNAEIFELGRQAAFEAGQILMENFGRISEVSKKEDGSLVTNVDVEAEERIVSLIRDRFPDHGILTEEREEVRGDSEYRWIIDPIDGTHNYIHSLDVFGISIGVACSDKPFLGIIYFPCSKKFYHCEKNKGAYVNGERIHVSNRGVKEAFLTHNSNFHIDGQEQMLEGFKRLVNLIFKVRMFGSCIVHFTHIADGRVDLAVEYGIKLWDLYAGALMVEEAGGKVTDFSGRPWHLSNGPYIASNGVFHDEIQKLLSDIK